MRAAAQRQQLPAGVGEVLRLVEELTVADQDLVGPEHETVGRPRGAPQRLELGQRVGDVARRRRLRQHGRLHRRFVDGGGHGLEGDPGIAEHCCPRGRA